MNIYFYHMSHVVVVDSVVVVVEVNMTLYVWENLIIEHLFLSHVSCGGGG